MQASDVLIRLIFALIVIVLLLLFGYKPVIEILDWLKIGFQPPSRKPVFEITALLVFLVLLLLVVLGFAPGKTTLSGILQQSPFLGATSAERAIRDYYSLIERKEYELAWEMSSEYNRGKGLSLDTYISEWEQSGPARIVGLIDVEEDRDKAIVELTLYYPKKGAYHLLHYELLRDERRGDERFDYWIFVAGKVLD